MYIIGLSGAIASGKTTLADYLGVQSGNAMHWESWQVVAEVAEALRSQSLPHPRPDDLDAINAWLDILPAKIATLTQKTAPADAFILDLAKLAAHPEDYLKLLEYLEAMQSQPKLQTAAITLDNKDAMRSILQWLGGFLVKVVDPGIWYDSILQRIQAQSGLDLATVGGVRYPSDAERLKQAGGIIIAVERPGSEQRDSADLTERERSLIKVDVTVTNIGNLSDLQIMATKIYKDLQNGTVRPAYAPLF